MFNENLTFGPGDTGRSGDGGDCRLRSGRCQSGQRMWAKGVRALVVISMVFNSPAPRRGTRNRTPRVGSQLRYAHGRPELHGVINTDPAINLNATFSPTDNAPGDVSFLTQSGAIGEVSLDYARSLNVKLTHISALGTAPMSRPMMCCNFGNRMPRPKSFCSIWKHSAIRRILCASPGGYLRKNQSLWLKAAKFSRF